MFGIFAKKKKSIVRNLDVGEVEGDYIGCYLFGIEGDESNPPSYHSVATSREELVSDSRVFLRELAQRKRDLVESSLVAARHEQDLRVIVNADNNLEAFVNRYLDSNDSSPFLRVAGINIFLRKGVRVREKINGKYIE